MTLSLKLSNYVSLLFEYNSFSYHILQCPTESVPCTFLSSPIILPSTLAPMIILPFLNSKIVLILVFKFLFLLPTTFFSQASLLQRCLTRQISANSIKFIKYELYYTYVLYRLYYARHIDIRVINNKQDPFLMEVTVGEISIEYHNVKHEIMNLIVSFKKRKLVFKPHTKNPLFLQ